MAINRPLLFLVILPALLMASCGCGRPYVLVGAKEPEYLKDSQWFKAHERAGRARTTEWRAKYNQYSQLLLARAAEAGLDSACLSNVLQVIVADAPRKRRAYVPFAAYRLRSNTNPPGSYIWPGNMREQMSSSCTIALTQSTRKTPAILVSSHVCKG